MLKRRIIVPSGSMLINQSKGIMGEDLLIYRCEADLTTSRAMRRIKNKLPDYFMLSNTGKYSGYDIDYVREHCRLFRNRAGYYYFRVYPEHRLWKTWRVQLIETTIYQETVVKNCIEKVEKLSTTTDVKFSDILFETESIIF